MITSGQGREKCVFCEAGNTRERWKKAGGPDSKRVPKRKAGATPKKLVDINVGEVNR